MSAADKGRDDVAIHVPTKLPTLTKPVSRILLAILVELTEIEILDGPAGRDTE